MLELLLQGLHTKKVAHDDWRDPDEKNPSLSISSKGLRISVVKADLWQTS